MQIPINQIFYSKRDSWATLMVWSITAVCCFFGFQILLAPPYDGQLLEGAITLLAGMVAPWFWLTTRYRFMDYFLLLKSGPLFKRIAYADIMAVKNGHKERGLSFAFSMDCLQIDVAGSKLGFRVSPREQEKFLHALASRCDHLDLKGRELVLKNKTNR